MAKRKFDATGLQHRMAASVATIPSQDTPRIFRIRLEEIQPNPHQPRKHFDEAALQELARSIERHGLLQPITVKRIEGADGYLLIAGERRYRAHGILGREDINAVVTDGDAAELAVIENVQREDLHPLELAEGLAQLQLQHGYSQEQLADIIGKRRNTVNEILRLNTLPPQIKEECRTSDTATKSVLIQIARVPDEDEQLTLWQAAKGGATVKTARRERRTRERPDADAARPYEEMVAVGRSFARKLEALPPEWTIQDQDHYQQLAALRDQLVAALAMYDERAKQAAGDQEA